MADRQGRPSYASCELLGLGEELLQNGLYSLQQF
ncbi:unnamed protein product, partial [marine sediment metagenome]